MPSKPLLTHVSALRGSNPIQLSSSDVAIQCQVQVFPQFACPEVWAYALGTDMFWASVIAYSLLDAGHTPLAQLHQYSKSREDSA